MTAMMGDPEMPDTPEQDLEDDAPAGSVRDSGEPDGDGFAAPSPRTPRPGSPRPQRIARFEGIHLRLRNGAAGHYVLGVDVELGLPDGVVVQASDFDGEAAADDLQAGDFDGQHADDASELDAPDLDARADGADADADARAGDAQAGQDGQLADRFGNEMDGEGEQADDLAAQDSGAPGDDLAAQADDGDDQAEQFSEADGDHERGDSFNAQAEDPGDDHGELASPNAARLTSVAARPLSARPLLARAAPAAKAPAAARKPAGPRIKLADVQPGKKNNSVLIVQKALAKAVGLNYSSGPGTFGPATKAAYAKWQHKCGYSGSAANGVPGASSLNKLGAKYGFTVAAGATPAKKGRMPGATWRPIPVNYTANGQREVRGVVIHIMEGTLAGTDSWFRNPKASASAHFGTGTGGQLYQWVDAKDRAWAQRSGNPSWLSIENEGHAGDRLTAKQVERCAQILAWAHRTYGVPLQIASSPDGRGLGHHSMGAPAWGHSGCPGQRIIQQKPAIVARAKQIVSSGATPRSIPPTAVARPAGRAIAAG